MDPLPDDPGPVDVSARAWLIRPEESEHDQRRAAGALLRAGLAAGDRVALAVPNAPEVLAVVLGASRVGVVPVMLNATLLDTELDTLIADAEPGVVLRSLADIAALLDGAPAYDLAPLPLCRPMHYTSGTSGRPKGVWPGVLDEPTARRMHEDEAAVWGLGPADLHLTCSPLYHSVAIRFSAQALLRGAPVVLLERFDAATVAGAIAEHGVRSAFMVPTHLQRLLALPELPDLAGIHLLAHAGAACPIGLKRRLFEQFPEGSVWEFYGASEGQFTVCPPEDWLAHPGTVGRARAGRKLEIDDQGHIWCHVPDFARWSYWNDPAKTEAAWRDDAFTVHDIGRLDPDGFLFLDGRRDDLIISGGVNVYPAEVEQALGDLPGVDEIAVFGAPDEQWGQRVCAAVIGTASVAAVTDAARSRLAAYKRPKSIYSVSDLPRTGTGKIRRAHIAEWLGLC